MKVRTLHAAKAETKRPSMIVDLHGAKRPPADRWMMPDNQHNIRARKGASNIVDQLELLFRVTVLLKVREFVQ